MPQLLRNSSLWLVAIVVLSLSLTRGAAPSEAATVPGSFADGVFAAGLSAPTAMAFAPDGRLFVTEQTGALRVIKNGVLLPTPFVTLPVDSAGERGLLGVAFDPAFVSNHFVYVYYTSTIPTTHNRISRFTANGDVAVPGSEVVLLDLDNLSAASNHNGGAIHFGPDGKLYAGVGENANSANSQTLGNLLGKMLRINSDGTIPTDNPFFGTATGKNRAIWAMGLRNPFTFAFQPGTTRMFIDDVGENTWEEINDGIAGSNYGWPITEGVTANPSFRSPLFAYGHGSTATTGCAIAGGAFYNPATPNFPASYVGKYFHADLCTGWIRMFDPAIGSDTAFAQGINQPVDLQVGPDGALYYLAHAGSVGRIAFTNPASQIEAPAAGNVTSSFTVSGWAIDKAATSNTGIDLVHVYVYPADANGNITGAAQFLGVASYGMSRPDIAALNGAQFGPSGYSFNVSNLAAGRYLLATFAHSVVSNNWDPMGRAITVQAPQTPQPNPKGNIDSPGAKNVGQSFMVNGWAIDQGAPTGTGVDLVHAYAYPTDANGNVTGAAKFLGVASYGGMRPDVSGLFGAQFQPSGFTLSVNNLAAGNYLLAVFARSTVNSIWSPMARQISVQAPQSTPRGSIDSPAVQSIGRSFQVNGWFIDQGAPSGTGIDLVHVYIYPADGAGNITGAAQFLGVANYGGMRPDISGLYGAQFQPSGYTFNASNVAAGHYLLAVFARSTVNNVWSPLARIVDVGAGQSQAVRAEQVRPPVGKGP